MMFSLNIGKQMLHKIILWVKIEVDVFTVIKVGDVIGSTFQQHTSNPIVLTRLPFCRLYIVMAAVLGSQLARLTGMSPATITRIVTETP